MEINLEKRAFEWEKDNHRKDKPLYVFYRKNILLDELAKSILKRETEFKQAAGADCIAIYGFDSREEAGNPTEQMGNTIRDRAKEIGIFILDKSLSDCAPLKEMISRKDFGPIKTESYHGTRIFIGSEYLIEKFAENAEGMMKLIEQQVTERSKEITEKIGMPIKRIISYSGLLGDHGLTSILAGKDALPHFSAYELTAEETGRISKELDETAKSIADRVKGSILPNVEVIVTNDAYKKLAISQDDFKKIIEQEDLYKKYEKEGCKFSSEQQRYILEEKILSEIPKTEEGITLILTDHHIDYGYGGLNYSGIENHLSKKFGYPIRIVNIDNAPFEVSDLKCIESINKDLRNEVYNQYIDNLLSATKTVKEKD